MRVNFDDVAGIDEVKEEISEIVAALMEHETLGEAEAYAAAELEHTPARPCSSEPDPAPPGHRDD